MERITPTHIAKLEPNEIFVFGSNTKGIHGAGAAWWARERFGAELLVGEGLTGQCYALPTCDYTDKGIVPSSMADVEKAVARFIECAKKNTDKVFYVTRVGCGIAGFTDADIAPMFRDALEMENVYLPQEFVDYLTSTT